MEDSAILLNVLYKKILFRINEDHHWMSGINKNYCRFIIRQGAKQLKSVKQGLSGGGRGVFRAAQRAVVSMRIRVRLNSPLLFFMLHSNPVRIGLRDLAIERCFCSVGGGFFPLKGGWGGE